MDWTSLWQKRGVRRAAWLVATVAVLMAASWAAAPSLIKSQIETQGSAVLGRKVTVAAVDFKPWTLELTLSDLRIASADGKSDQLAIERLYADAEMQSVLRLAPVIDAITVDAPQIHISHTADGKFDFDDVLEHLAKRPGDPQSGPMRFALYNVVVNNGSLDFADQVGQQQRVHVVRQIHMALPFLSNLASQREVTVQPHLAFSLNGTAFDSAALATPFAPTAKGEVTVKIDKLDLAPYLSYLPSGLPVALKGAVLDTNLKIAFEQTSPPKVSVAGSVTVSDLKLDGPDGAALASAAVIHTVLKDVRPLEQVVVLDSLEVTRLKLHASRDSSGKLNLDMASAKPEQKPGLKPDSKSDAKSNETSTAAAAQPVWRFALDHFKLSDGELLWADRMESSPVQWRLGDVDVAANDVRWPAAVASANQKPLPPLRFEGGASLEAMGAARPGAKPGTQPGAQPPAKTARLTFKGENSGNGGAVDVKLADLGLGLLAPYVAQYLVPRADGVLSADAKATWDAAGVKVAVQRALLEKFAMTADAPAVTANANININAREWPAFDALEISDSTIDLAARTASIGKLALRKPAVRVVRNDDASWMFARWIKPQPAAVVVPAPAPAPAPVTKPAAPWAVTVADVSIDNGSVVFVDRVPAKRVFIDLSGLNARVQNLTLDGNKPAPVTVAATVRSGRTDPGTLSFNGTAMWAPVTAQGLLELKQIPLQAAAPYLVERYNIELLRADANFKGQVRFAASDAGATVQVKGDASLDDLRVNSVLAVQKGSSGEPGTEELLNWKSLAAPGVDLTLAPGEPLRLKLREVALSDFFARLIVSADGRLVLQDLVKPQERGAVVNATPGAASAQAPAIPSGVAGSTAKALAPVIDVGPITIVNGRVAFSDRFIKPNYSADLSALNGKLSRFASQSPDGSVLMADVELKGRAEGTAGLEISGKVNPLAKPLALDVHGKVRDLELSPLSSYAIKYAGYGIERGKLSVDVNYAIEPDGQLTATNNIVLSQLTFGDKVEGGASLPVKLAVALLSDSNGVIDLNLPIRGSINDPEFRIWPIVWKVIGNLLTKALTSPFSLFSGGGSEEEDLAIVAFVPGTAVISPDAIAGLDKAVKALIDKPSLKTTVVGSASLEAERDAIKLERLNRLMLAEKRRAAGTAGKDVALVSTITDAEYPVILREVYRRSDYKKPRNIVGLTKDMPVGEMRTFMLDNIAVNEDDVRELARLRGVVVREYLTAHQLPSERIFLGAEDVAPAAPTWKPQAELSVISD